MSVSMSFFGGVVVFGLLIQWGVYRLVQRPQWLANPEARSSHTQPTPTMGGISIVVLVLAFLVFGEGVPADLRWTLVCALAGLAVVGLWDDLRQLSARMRIVVHFIAAGLVLWLLNLPLSWLGQAAFLIGLVWLINLYNFMDGIDGYAAVQCLLFCLGAIGISAGIPGWSGQLAWVLVGASLAFLGFNWPPAKIFMGDVASGFLGLALGFLALYWWQLDLLPLVASLILLAGFWFDASYTLCVRILTRQAFTQAHRSHLYQHLAAKHGHLRATLALLLYGLVWLLPLAWSAANPPYAVLEETTGQMLVLGLAVLPMGIACWRIGAGRAPIQRSQPMARDEE